MIKRPIGIAGAGRIGQSIGRLLYQAGSPVVAVASRTTEKAAKAAEFIGAGVRPVAYEELPSFCSRLIVAVPDDAVRPVASLLAQSGWQGGTVIHTCGVHGLDVLKCLQEKGTSCAALHPLQTVPSPERGQTALIGCLYVLTGEGEAGRWAREIVELVHGRMLEIPNESRPLYHAAAVLICNDLVVLLEAGLRLLEQAGLTREEAASGFKILAQQSVNNVFDMNRGMALTGPIVRGDLGTIECHLRALAANSNLEEVENIYRVLGLYAVRLAAEQGLDGIRARKLNALLKEQE